MDKKELKRVYAFLLKYENLFFTRGDLFSIDVLKDMRNRIDEEKKNDFILTTEQEQLLIDIFLKECNEVTEDTPYLFFYNKDCIKKILKRNIYQIDSFPVFFMENDRYILDILKEKHYIIHKNSPFFIRKDFEIVLDSIKHNKDVVNFIEWDSFSKEQVEKLIHQLLFSGYVLGKESPMVLKKNKLIALNSLQKDKKSINYIHRDLLDDKDIFKYLVMHGCRMTDYFLDARRLSVLYDEMTMGYFLERFAIYNNLSECAKKKFKLLFLDFLQYKPTIKSFLPMFEMMAEEKWRIECLLYPEKYKNILAKICSTLQNHNVFSTVLKKLDLLTEMKEILGNKYEILLKAMKKYHMIYHSNTVDSSHYLEQPLDSIAKMSSLYISKLKEEYKKREIQCFLRELKQFYIIDENSTLVHKRIIEVRQKEKFKKLYSLEDLDIKEFILEIKHKYGHLLSFEEIDKVIDQFIYYTTFDINELRKKPEKYDAYVFFLKVSKLVHRLNSFYITIDSKEVANYRESIFYNERKKQYYYVGENFSEDQVKEFKAYEQYVYYVNLIKKEIMLKIKNLEVNTKVDKKTINQLNHTLPFTDSHFIFSEAFFTACRLGIFKRACFEDICLTNDSIFNEETLVNEEFYKILHYLLVDCNYFTMLLMMYSGATSFQFFRSHGVSKKDMYRIFNYLPSCIQLMHNLQMNERNFANFIRLEKMISSITDFSIALLGMNTVTRLCMELDYTDKDSSRIISLATELMCRMHQRYCATVPYVKGETKNYKYRMYDSLESDVFLSGLDTNSCFKIDGTDHDFLCYSVLDKNGFVMKITNINDEFVAKVAGFRNGNTVYFNQLRTIYDLDIDECKETYKEELEEIIVTLRKASAAIVEESQRKSEEKDKIEYVFIVKSLALTLCKDTISLDVAKQIGEVPMDNKSLDWKLFLQQTESILKDSDSTYFATDYGDWPIICLASINKEEVTFQSIKPKDVDALYERKRNSIVYGSGINEELCRKVNKIKAVASYYKEIDFTMLDIGKDTTIFIGDNWYLLYDGLEIVASCVLPFDNEAKKEFQATLEVIETQKNLLDIQQNKDIKYLYLRK